MEVNFVFVRCTCTWFSTHRTEPSHLWVRKSTAHNGTIWHSTASSQVIVEINRCTASLLITWYFVWEYQTSTATIHTDIDGGCIIRSAAALTSAFEIYYFIIKKCLKSMWKRWNAGRASIPLPSLCWYAFRITFPPHAAQREPSSSASRFIAFYLFYVLILGFAVKKLHRRPMTCSILHRKFGCFVDPQTPCKWQRTNGEHVDKTSKAPKHR